ncbi:MAG: GNAT family N-acetyltransferase [Oscillospiraceae bacterium]|jgi:ribosomal protein S18 acetylase RimI-like enzyme|nr:GNAT family N-acetyltransferase [Oscillospiraceae bacterium]
MDNIRFGKAAPEDADGIYAFYRTAIAKMHAGGNPMWDENDYPTAQLIARDAARGKLFALWIDGAPAAALVIDEEANDAYRGVPKDFVPLRPAVIHRLCVNPAFQGCGLSRLIMQKAEELIARRGHDGILLDAFAQNNIAVSLYESLGYTNLGKVDIGVYIRDWHVVLFVKKISDEVQPPR